MNADSPSVASQTASCDQSPDDHVMKAPVDLAQLAIQSLKAHPEFHWVMEKWGLHIVSNGDKLILNGRLPSWYLKQLLQEIVRRLDGVRFVENHVVVVDPKLMSPHQS